MSQPNVFVMYKKNTLEVVSKVSFFDCFFGEVSSSEVVEHNVLWGDAEVVEH